MNFKLTAAMTLAAGALGWAANPAEQRQIRVCLDIVKLPLSWPLKIASEIYSRIDVKIDWRHSNCEAADIHVRWSEDDGKGPPGALGYAVPGDGVTIVIFLDRVRTLSTDPRVTWTVLGHVLAHEIGHMLGISRHSNSGVMKAQYSAWDHDQMLYQPLRFLPEDVIVIRQGIDARAGRFVTRGQPMANTGR